MVAVLCMIFFWYWSYDWLHQYLPKQLTSTQRFSFLLDYGWTRLTAQRTRVFKDIEAEFLQYNRHCPVCHHQEKSATARGALVGTIPLSVINYKEKKIGPMFSDSLSSSSYATVLATVIDLKCCWQWRQVKFPLAVLLFSRCFLN